VFIVYRTSKGIVSRRQIREIILFLALIYFRNKFVRGAQGIQIIKSAEFADKFKPNGIGCPVSVFCDNELCLSRGRCPLFIIPLLYAVVFRPVNKGNNIGIL